MHSFSVDWKLSCVAFIPYDDGLIHISKIHVGMLSWKKVFV